MVFDCMDASSETRPQALHSRASPGLADPASRGWRREAHAGFVDTIGPLWIRTDGHVPRFGFVVEAKHLNRIGSVHGGMLLSVLDHAFGMAVVASLRTSQAATVQMSAQFVGAVRAGDFVETDCTVLRRTRSLMFLRGECRVGDTIVVAADGVFKLFGAHTAAKHDEPAAP
jgi:uncharacterized protein (TIGR00369 family)